MSAVMLTAALLAVAMLVWPGRRSARAARAALRRQRGPRASTITDVARRVGRRLLGLRTAHQADLQTWLSVLDQLSASLRVGLPPVEALTMALTGASPTVRGILAGVLDAARAGHPCGPSWTRASRATGSAEVELLARSWSVSEQLGAPLADAVDSSARALRTRRELARRLDTATAGARTTAALLTLLPVAGVGLALIMGISPGTLYGSPLALASLLAGVGLLVTGRVIVTGMITRVQGGTS